MLNLSRSFIIVPMLAIGAIYIALFYWVYSLDLLKMDEANWILINGLFGVYLSQYWNLGLRSLCIPVWPAYYLFLRIARPLWSHAITCSPGTTTSF